MTDEPSSGPPRVPVTAEFLAECRRKQAAYEATRRRHRAGFERRSDDEGDEPAGATAQLALPSSPQRRRSRGKTHDPRQLKLEL